jgi:hypothetical protein
MPACRTTTRYRDRRSNDPNHEDYIQEAIGLVGGGDVSFRTAAKMTMVRLFELFEQS